MRPVELKWRYDERNLFAPLNWPAELAGVSAGVRRCRWRRP